MKANQTIAGCSAVLAFVLGAAPSHVRAQDPDEKAQIRELAARVDALQKQVDAQKAAATAAAPAPAPAAGVASGDLPGSFKIPGTSTSLKIGGMARLDVVKDFGGGEFGAIGIPPLVPLKGSAQDHRRGQFSMNARESRLYVRALTPTPWGALTTHLEGDFYGAGGNELVTNSTGFRLRHAYAEVGPWLVGQTWTNFVELSTFPETIDFEGGHGTLATIRAAQFRVTGRLGTSHRLSASAENPVADLYGTVAPTYAAGVGPTSSTTLSKAPDVNAKYVYSGSWLTFAAGGLVRWLTFNNYGGAAVAGVVGERSTTTVAWMAESAIKTFGRDSIQLHYTQGPGAGRYVLAPASGTAAVIENGKLEGISQLAFAAGYRRFWTDTIRMNVIYGRVESDLPHPAVADATISRSEAFYANVIWEPIPKALVGLEWQRAKVRNDLKQTGQNDRVLTSFAYSF